MRAAGLARVCLLAAMFAACGARATPTESASARAAEPAGRDVELGSIAATTVAMGATPDVVFVALGPLGEVGHDARFLALDPEGGILARGEVSAGAPPFVIEGTDGHTLEVVWPGALDAAALAPLEASYGATRVRHRAASAHFTLPYAGVALASDAGATDLVVLHRDAVSCFVAGTTTAASLVGDDAAPSFRAPNGLYGELSLARFGDGFVAVFHPGEGQAASAWQVLDRHLAPTGPASALDDAGCRLAVSLGRGTVLACDDRALVIDEGGSLVRRIDYPLPGRALALASAGPNALVAVWGREGAVLVALPEGERVDVLSTPLVGVPLDVFTHVAIAATDAHTFFVAWAEGPPVGPGVLRVRRYTR